MTSKWHKHQLASAILWGLPLFAACAPPDASEAGELTSLEADAYDAGADLLNKATVVGVLQAENTSQRSGCTIATKNTGYTGSGYINFGGNGTWMEWNNVNVATAGNYTLTFRYATATGPRQTAILINGTNTGNVPFESTGSVTTWKTASITKALKAGNNTIRVLANTANGGPNLDKMEVSAAVVSTPVALPYSMAAAFACSTKACTWTSDAINIQGVSNVVIFANARADQYGQLESSDYLKMSYRIDNGSWVNFFDHVDDLTPQAITKAVSASGKQLQVMITALTNSSNETYSVSSLTVAKQAADTPPQTGWQCNKSYYGTGDGCDCSCGAPDPDCNGGGCTAPGCSSSACKRYHATCPTGSSCSLVPETFGGRWADVEKDPRTNQHDDLFCWVAGPSNILDWSGWGQVGGLKTTDDIFLYSQNYWPPNSDVGSFDSGDDAYDFLKWFFVGDQTDEDFPAGGGFYPNMSDFSGYCGGDTSGPYLGLCSDEMASDSKAIMKVLNAGFAAAIQLKGDVGGVDGGHVITLWGYSVDKSNPGLMTGVFLTDSDDDEGRSNPPDRLFYRKVTYSGGVWHILTEKGSPYKYIKFVYGVKKR